MHALAVKRYDHKVDLFISGNHDASSHAVTSSILTEKQRTAVRTAVRTSPMTVGSAVHDGLKNLSPGNHVKADRRSREAVARLVRRERTVMAEERSAGVDVDGSYGSMLEFAQQMDLGAKIRRHNDTSNPCQSLSSGPARGHNMRVSVLERCNFFECDHGAFITQFGALRQLRMAKAGTL